MRLTIISYQSFICAKIQSFPESSNFFKKKTVIPFHYRNLFVFLQVQSERTARHIAQFLGRITTSKEKKGSKTIPRWSYAMSVDFSHSGIGACGEPG